MPAQEAHATISTVATSGVRLIALWLLLLNGLTISSVFAQGPADSPAVKADTNPRQRPTTPTTAARVPVEERLSRDTAHFLLRKWDKQSITDLNLVACQFLRLCQRKFCGRVLNLFDNGLLNGDLDLAFFVVPFDLDAVTELVMSFELLPGSCLYSLLHRLDHKIAVNALFVAQYFYALSD